MGRRPPYSDACVAAKLPGKGEFRYCPASSTPGLVPPSASMIDRLTGVKLPRPPSSCGTVVETGEGGVRGAPQYAARIARSFSSTKPSGLLLKFPCEKVRPYCFQLAARMLRSLTSTLPSPLASGTIGCCCGPVVL